MSFWSFRRKRNDEYDNFTIIAQNMAVIYSTLKSTPFGSSLGDEQLLYGTALIDTLTYLIERQISTDDLCYCTLSACANEVSLLLYSVRLFDAADVIPYRDLVCLTLQIIAQIAWTESKAGNLEIPINYRACVDMAASKRDRIANIIQETMEHISEVPFYERFFSNAKSAIDIPEVRNAILSYPDTIPLFSALEIKETWYTCPACGQLVPFGKDCDCGFKYSTTEFQLALDALQKVEHLRKILAKGYCQNPYTKENMLDIDDFIAYVERFNEEAENILKRKNQSLKENGIE